MQANNAQSLIKTERRVKHTILLVSSKVGHATNGPAKNRGFNFAMVIELEDEDVFF